MTDPREAIERVIAKRRQRGATDSHIYAFVTELRATWKGSTMNQFLTSQLQ